MTGHDVPLDGGTPPAEPPGRQIFDLDSSVSRTPGMLGRTRALTVLSPFPRIWAAPLRAVLWFKRHQGPDPMLQRLSFIHAAHWVLIDRFPGETARNRYAYLLFVSNFNGSWRDYIDAFATAIPKRMAILWGASYGFPGPQPPKPFVNYIERNQLAPAHLYGAYPEASATEVASALRVSDLFHQHVVPAADGDGAEFAAAWRTFLDSAQRDL